MATRARLEIVIFTLLVALALVLWRSHQENLSTRQVLGREAILQRSTERPWEGESPMGVAILFHTYAGLRHPGLWHQWFEDAHEWIRTDSRFSGVNSTSAILQGFVHYLHVFERSYVQALLPPSLKESALERPGICSWKSTVECTLELYITAYDKMPSAEMFILVSHNTVPLKSFKSLYLSLEADTRNRFAFSTLLFTPKEPTPKYSNWKILNREAIELLIAYRDRWTHQPLLKLSGTDELLELKALMGVKGEAFLSTIDCAVWLDNADLTWFQKRMRKVHHRFCKSPGFTYECWGHCTSPLMEPSPGGPVTYLIIGRDLLDSLIDLPHVYFGRKFNPDSLVADCAEGGPCLVTQYITQRLNLQSNNTPFSLPQNLPPAPTHKVLGQSVIDQLLHSCHPAIRHIYKLPHCKK